jgi:hypothetical protein
MSVYSIQANFAGVSQVTSSLGPNDPEVGTRLRSGDEDYLFVYNAGNSQINPGHAAIVSAVTGYSVTVSSVTSVDFAVGFVKHATLTTGTYGWLLTKGFGSIEAEASASFAAGALAILAADGTVTNKTISTGFVGTVCAKAMEAIASGASGQAYICTGN